MDKKQIRSTIIAKRNTLTEEQLASKSQIIREKIIISKEFQKAKHIMLFAAFGSELRLLPLIDIIIKLGKHPYFPVVDKDTMQIFPIEVKRSEDLLSGYYGIPEPNKKYFTPETYKQLDLVLTPAVAFDHQGNRLGYGAGFYDRFFPLLNKDIKKIGVAFHEQIVNSLPFEKHDIPLDTIITDHEILYIRKD
ncbi:MAG: 5-formyltetrahydrofolate cyclo-ligase [Suipraeoptans sp.]